MQPCMWKLMIQSVNAKSHQLLHLNTFTQRVSFELPVAFINYCYNLKKCSFIHKTVHEKFCLSEIERKNSFIKFTRVNPMSIYLLVYW